MSADTTVLSYWLNWRFFTCAAFIVAAIVFAVFLIWKYEGSKRRNQQQKAGHLYEHESWKTCLKVIHPAWLLGYRIIAFIILLSLITGNVIIDGWGIFYFYTQWTFALVTIYFALGSVVSSHGCCKHHSRLNDHVKGENFNSERESFVPLRDGESSNSSNLTKNPEEYKIYASQTARIVGYSFQILFQMCAGAVVLTDCVFWFVIYPFLTSADFKLKFFDICMHSVNAVFLLGDTLLSGLRFPMFRIAYFILWTSVFVIFHWIFHSWVNLWWPYPFLDLSSQYAPIWYVAVGLMHIPCYGVYALVVRFKNFWLLRSFPEAYQGVK